MKLRNLFKTFIPQKPTLLGLTLDPISLRLVELGKAGNDYLVRHCSQTPIKIPPNLPLEKEGIHHPEFSDFLKKTLHTSNISTHQVALALPHSSVLFKTIELDKTLTETDIAIQVRTHAEQYFNYPLSELMMDFELLGVSKKHPNLREVRWVAARRPAVEVQIEALTAAGLNVVSVEVDSFSLHRAADFYLKKQNMPTDNVVVIHIEDSRWLMLVMVQDEFHTHGEDYYIEGGEQAIEAHISQLVSTKLANQPALILLSGRGVSDGLAVKIQKHTQISTRCLDVFSTLHFFTPCSAPEFSICAGLAMQVIS